MNAGTTLQVRMDRRLKKEAEGVFKEVGLDATTAVRMFYTKVVKTRSIPFRLQVDAPEFSPEQEERILAAWQESKDPKNLSGPYNSAEEVIASLHASSSRRQAPKTKAAARKKPRS